MRFRSLLAERLEYACASGRFDRARWKAAGIEEPLRIGEADESVLPILAFPGCIGERLQRCLLAYLWEEWHFYGIVCCGAPVCAVGRGIPFLAAASGAASGLFAVP